MTITVMKKTILRLKPKLIDYRDYRFPFFNEKFREEVLSKTSLSMENIRNTSNDPEIFLRICIGVLDRLASQKKKNNRTNNMPFMKKPLSLEHIKGSRLQNKSSKTGSEVSGINLLNKIFIV